MLDLVIWFWSIFLELGLICLQFSVSGPWRKPPPPWELPFPVFTPLFLAEWPSSWPSRESVGLSSPPTRPLPTLRRRTPGTTPTSRRQPPRLGPRPRGSTTPDPEVGGGVHVPANVLSSLRRMTKYTAGMNRKITNQPRPQSCKLCPPEVHLMSYVNLFYIYLFVLFCLVSWLFLIGLCIMTMYEWFLLSSNWMFLWDIW